MGIDIIASLVGCVLSIGISWGIIKTKQNETDRRLENLEEHNLHIRDKYVTQIQLKDLKDDIHEIRDDIRRILDKLTARD